MLTDVNQNNENRIDCLKTNLNIENININIKHLRKSNRPLTETPSTPGNQAKETPHSTRHLLLTPNK